MTSAYVWVIARELSGRIVQNEVAKNFQPQPP